MAASIDHEIVKYYCPITNKHNLTIRDVNGCFQNFKNIPNIGSDVEMISI